MELKKPSSTILDHDDHYLEENSLINGLINNEDRAYEHLIRNFGPKMYSVARRFFNTDDDAQECLQKSFIQVFKNISSFNQQSKITTWLHRITVNEALMMLRQRKRQQTSSLEDFYQHYNEHGERTEFIDHLGSDINNNIEALFEANETKLTLNEIIYQLPEKYCNVLLLRDIQEISTKETSEILAISEAAVKTQLHRARLLLKEILMRQDKSNLEQNW